MAIIYLLWLMALLMSFCNLRMWSNVDLSSLRPRWYLLNMVCFSIWYFSLLLSMVSVILHGVAMSDMGLYDVGSDASSCGLRRGMTSACFHCLGRQPSLHVRWVMSNNGFRLLSESFCRMVYDMVASPGADVFVLLCIMSLNSWNLRSTGLCVSAVMFTCGM